MFSGLERLSSGLKRISSGSSDSSSRFSRASSSKTTREDDPALLLPTVDRIAYDANPPYRRNAQQPPKALIDGRPATFGYELVRSANAQARFLGGNPGVLKSEAYKKALNGLKQEALANHFSPDQAEALAAHGRSIARQTKAVVKRHEFLQETLADVLSTKAAVGRSRTPRPPKVASAALRALYQRLISFEVSGDSGTELARSVWNNTNAYRRSLEDQLDRYEACERPHPMLHGATSLRSEHSLPAIEDVEPHSSELQRADSRPGQERRVSAASGEDVNDDLIRRLNALRNS